MASFCYWCVGESLEGDLDPMENDFARQVVEPLWIWFLCERCGMHLFDPRGIPYCGADLTGDQRFQNCWNGGHCWICTKHEHALQVESEHPKPSRRWSTKTARSEFL